MLQVKGRDYNPPKREKIRQFQEQQEFPICPNFDDPDACNVYKNLNSRRKCKKRSTRITSRR